MVKFVQLLNKFFIQQELELSEVDENFLYLKALRRRKLDNYFFKKADQMKKQWDKAPPAGLEHLHNEYRLTRMYCSHPSYDTNRGSPKGLDLIVNSIDKFFSKTILVTGFD